MPGEITKQSLFAPPRIMRSTRYSLTARGRSLPVFHAAAHRQQLLRERQRLNPAARARRRNDPPHRSSCSLLRCHRAAHTPRRSARSHRRFQLAHPALRRMLLQRSLARRHAPLCRSSSSVRASTSTTSCAVSHEKDLLARREEAVHPLPRVAHQRSAAGRSLKQPPRRTIAVLRHRAPGHVQCRARGAEELPDAAPAQGAA